MQRIYGDLFKGPSQQLTLPAPPSQEGPLAPDTPETLAHLTATTDVLRRKFVEEIHRAAIDLGARCEAVGVEDAKQEVCVCVFWERLFYGGCVWVSCEDVWVLCVWVRMIDVSPCGLRTGFAIYIYSIYKW